MYIGNESIYLKPITYEDTDMLVGWRNSDEVRPYFIDQNLFTTESHTKWLDNYVFTKKVYQFIVYDKNNDVPFGCAYLRDVDMKNKKAEYGTFIGKREYKGKGLGTQMALITSEYAFNELMLHKVFARVFASNVASQNSFIKAGFEKEAYLKDEVIINGEYRDIVLFGKISKDR